IDKYILHPTKVLLRLIYLSFNFLPILIYFPTCFVGDEKTKNRRFNSFYNYLTYRIELAGPTFVKLGQWAATRADLFPKEFCEVLSKLHSRVNPHPISYTRKLFQECFPGLTLEDVFDEFLEKPIGVGAMAQVYRAKLKKDLVYQDLPNINNQLLAPTYQLPPLHNGYVAVKVLHPRARKSVERDLIILSILASVVTTLVPTLQWVSLEEEVKTFSKMMHEQLDLITEANNLTKLRHNFRAQKEVKFPRPILPLVSESILVEKFEHGVPLKKFMDLGEDGVFNQDIAAVGLNSFLKMLLLDNFIHADLHPGNIMVKFYRPSKDGWFNKLRSILDYTFKHQSIEDIFNKIRAEYPGDFNQFKEVLNDLYTISFYPQFIFLDAGLVTTLDDINRINFIDLFKSVAEFDGKKSGELIIDRSSRPEQVTNREEFVEKMSKLILHLRSSAFKLSSVDISSLLGNVFSMVRNHRVKLEGEFVNVVMSIMILEGVGRTLDPELDLFREALPLLRSLGTSTITPMPMSDGPFWFIKIWFGLEARQIL
ncbi:ABC1-domain-containing protein, partial [Conidiobolus coronatus NRRL 28638]